MTQTKHVQSGPAHSTPVEARILAAFAIVAATTIVAALCGVISANESEAWRQQLHQTPGQLSDFVFAVVLPTLYSLMTIGALLVWNSAGSWRRADSAIGVYFAQLAANLGWMTLLFHLQQPLAALIALCILAILVGVMIVEFHRHNRIAAQLQAPYVAGIGLALCFNVWVLTIS